MLDSFDYYLLSPDLNNTIIDCSSQLSTASHVRTPGTSLYFQLRSFIFLTQYPIITYQRRETLLLSPPHNTRCMDYRRVGLESQLHCLHDCLKHQSIQTLRLVPTDVSIFRVNETIVPLISEEQMLNVSIRESLSVIRSSCREKCQNPNCRDESFKPFNPTFSYYDIYANSTNATFSISVPNWPDILIETGIAFRFVDYMMTLLNAVSLWTALCPMDLKKLRFEKIKLNIGTFSFVKKMLPLPSRAWKWLVTLLCLSACLYQLQESAVQYFEYKTVSKVLIQMVTKRNPPAITLCTRVIKLSDHKTLTEAFEFGFNTNKLVMQEDQRSGRTEHFLKSYDQCSSFYPSIRHVSTYNPQEKLYTFSLWNGTKYDAGEYTVIMHDPNQQIHGKYDSYTLMEVIKYKYFTIFFTAFKNKFLPPPYETYCRDYSATKFQSQDHCIESCAISLSLDQRGVFPLFVSPAYDPLPVAYDQHFNLTILTMLRKSCESFCRHQDCQKITFTTRYGVITIPELNLRLAVSDSTEFSFHTESVAAIDPITYGTKFLGSIAFWTGICPFGVFFSEKILSVLKRPALPNLSYRCYVSVVVMLSAAAYAFQVFMMAGEYFKYGTANTIAFQSKVGQESVSLTFCHDFLSNQTDQLSSLDTSNTFSQIVIDDRSFIPPHERGSQTAQQETLILLHYKIFGLLCHSIRIDETHRYSSYKLSKDLQVAVENKIQSSDDSLVRVGIAPHLQNNLMNRRVGHAYLSMSSKTDMLYNSNNNFVPISSHGYLGHNASTLDWRVVEKKNMPAPYDTQCKHHVDGDRIITSNECFHSCYSSISMKKYALFPFDSPRQLMARNTTFEFPFMGQADKLIGREDERQTCIRRCGNDCQQVNYYLRELTLPAVSKFRTFVIIGRGEKIAITHSAAISFWDLVSVMLNGASFYFSFCPATLLLSHWLWSRMIPTRVEPENELEETEMDQLPNVSIQQRDDVDEESKSYSNTKQLVTNENKQACMSNDASRLRHGRHEFLSRVTPARFSPVSKLLDTDRIQQEIGAAESGFVTNAQTSASHENGQVSFSVRNPDLKNVRVAWAKY